MLVSTTLLVRKLESNSIFILRGFNFYAHLQHKKKRLLHDVLGVHLYGGEGGIRTLDTDQGILP